MKRLSFLYLILLFFLLIDLFFFSSNKLTSGPLETRNLEPNNPKGEAITLLATGDVMLGRTVNIRVGVVGDFNYPYQFVKDELTKADVSLINLEGPLIENCPIINSGFTFCGDIKHIDGLVDAGIDVVNTANNHILNFGNLGLETTNKVVREHGLTLSNSVGPNYLNVGRMRFAFLGYNDLDYPTGSDLEKEKLLIKPQLSQARENADIIIVSMHWGNEYQSYPSVRQKELAHFLIDSGADLVVGNHPHWVQPVEVYKDKVITYSHGNFIFDQTWSEETKEGVIGKYTFFADGKISFEFLPIYIEEVGQPKIDYGPRGKRILDEMASESAKLTPLEN